MYIFRSIKEDICWYFKDEKEYVLGRRNTEILINDKSLSKTHATISLKNNNLFLTDLKSTYGTFVNDKKIDSQKAISLSVGDIIKFGILESVFKVEKLEFVTTATKLNDKQKSDLRTIFTYINGKIIDNWDCNCTHVTAVEFSLTVKILHAILDGKKVVTINFWKQLAKNINQHLPPPKEIDFTPPKLPVIQNFSLDFKPERKAILRNKIFIFSDRKTWKQLRDIVSKTSGESILWQDQPVSVNDLKKAKKQYLLISSDLSKDRQLNELIKYIHSVGQRTIALEEIGLAIVMCSCEKNCNPYYSSDSKSDVNLALSTQNSILAFESEVQGKNIENIETVESQDSVEIGPSYEPNIIDVEMITENEERRFKRPLDKDFESQAKKGKTDKMEVADLKSKKASLKRLLNEDNGVICVDDDIEPKQKVPKKEAEINGSSKENQDASSSACKSDFKTVNQFSAAKTPEKRIEQAKITNPFFQVFKNPPSASTSKKPIPQSPKKSTSFPTSDDEEENEIKYSQQMLENIPSATVIYDKKINNLNSTTTSTIYNKSSNSLKGRKKSVETTDLSKINWLNKELALKELQMKKERGELEEVDPKILEISHKIVELVPKKQLVQDSDYEDLITRINNSNIRGGAGKGKNPVGGKIFQKKWPKPFLEALKIKEETSKSC